MSILFPFPYESYLNKIEKITMFEFDTHETSELSKTNGFYENNSKSSDSDRLLLTTDFDKSNIIIDYDLNDLSNITQNNKDHELVLRKAILIVSIEDLIKRGEICDKILQLQFERLKENKNAKFIRLPNICIGPMQHNRFDFDLKERNSILLYLRKESEDYIDELFTKYSINIFGTVGIGKSFILYEMACRLRLMRDKYRVVYVNKCLRENLIENCLDSLISVLYDKVDRTALDILKKAFNSNGTYKEFSFVKNCIVECIQILGLNSYQVIFILDECNNLYEFIYSKSEIIKYLNLIITLRNIGYLIISESSDNEIQFDRKISENKLIPPIQISLNEMILFVKAKYKIDNFTQDQLIEVYSLTNGIFNEINRFFKEESSKPGLIPSFKQRKNSYCESYNQSYPRDLHDIWMNCLNAPMEKSRLEKEKYIRKETTIQLILSHFYQKPLLSDVGCELVVNPKFDQNFFHILEKKNNQNKHIECYGMFLTPLSIGKVMIHYKMYEFLVKLRNVNYYLVNSRLIQENKLLIEYSKIFTIYLRIIDSTSKNLSIKVYYNLNDSFNSTNLNFRNYAIEYFDADFPIISSIPSYNFFYFPFKFNNKSIYFLFYFFNT